MLLNDVRMMSKTNLHSDDVMNDLSRVYHILSYSLILHNTFFYVYLKIQIIIIAKLTDMLQRMFRFINVDGLCL